MIFSADEQESFYRLLAARRDVRSNFQTKPIPHDVLKRILNAAHQAPSVGFLQPWDFIIVNSDVIKQEIKENFEKIRLREAQLFEGERRELYNSLKLEAILEAPINICVSCDRTRNPENQLGRSSQNQMDLYSTVCAIQNMWLAARIEGIGMGWVSILDTDTLKKSLEIPDNIEVVGYFCLGYVDEFNESPELETKGWNQRIELDKLIKYNTWGSK